MTTDAAPQEQIATAQGRVAKNAAIYLFAQLLTWVASFTTVSIIPRRLGEDGMGQISLASSPVAMVSFAALMGVEAYITYEVGRDRRRTETLLRAAYGLRLFVVLPMVLVALAVLTLTGAGPTVMVLGSVLVCTSCVSLWSEPLRAALVGWESARRVAVLDFCTSLAPFLAIPFLFIASGDMVRRYGTLAIVLSGFAATLLVGIGRYVSVRRAVSLRPVIDRAVWKELARQGMPFLVNDFLLLAHAFVQILVLKRFTDAATVGVYSQAMRLIGTFMFIPTALSTAIIPTLARLAQTNPSEFRALQPRILSLLLVMGLPVGTMTLFLADPFCELLYGPTKFGRVPAVLYVGAFYLLPLYIVTMMYRFLVAQRMNLRWTGYLLGSISVAVSLSLVLVPYFSRNYGNGALGTLIACSVAELGSAICAFALLKVNPLDRHTVGRIVRALGACALMAAVMWPTRHLFLAIPAVLGLAVFVAAGWKLRLIGEEEQARLFAAVARRLGRSRN